MPFVQETLASYRTRVLRVLRDAQQQFFNAQGQTPGSDASFADIDAWIVQAQRWRDLWSGGSRNYRANVPLTKGLDLYTLDGTAAALFPTDTVLDIINLWLIWGTRRLPMPERSLSEVTAKTRQTVGFTGTPAMYCRYGSSQLFIATAPSSQFAADLDVAVLSTTLVAAADVDPLPYPYTEPVVYYAASLAKGEGQQKFQDAEVLMATAIRKLNDIEGARAGQLTLESGGRK